MTRTTAQLGATGTSTGGSIAVSLSYPQLTTSIFVPKTGSRIVDLHLKITQGGPQAITATPNMGGGTPGVPGTVIWMSANHVAMGVNQSMFGLGVNTPLRVPVSVGREGQHTGTFIVIGETHSVTVDFYGWTPGTLTFTGLTSKGVAFGKATGPIPDVVAMGSFDLTAMGGGTVTLVSPTKLSVDGRLSQQRTVSFSTLKLTFVPEASTLLLLGAALGALVLARRS